MQTYLWIAIGSALGGMARYWCVGAAAVVLGASFPWGTLIVNIAGSFLIGLIATLAGPEGRLGLGTTTVQFLTVGFLGGYTTFSAFSLQTLDLIRDGEMLRACGYVAGSVVLCLLAVWAGHLLAAGINGMKWV